MRLTTLALLALLTSLALSGCVGNGQGEEASRAKQFSREEFEVAMKKSGKSKELEEAKERERKYLEAQGGVQEEQR